jgi:hypothetical protein
MSRRSYITSTRLETIEHTLTDRQRSLVADVALLNVASGAQLRRLHFSDDETAQRMARRDLGQLVEHRVLSRLGRRIGGRGSESFVYSLDVAGQRIVRAGRRRYRAPWRPVPTHLQHALAVGDLYVELRRTGNQDARLVAFQAEPGSWRRFYGSGGVPVVLKPDAFVIVHNGAFEDRFFVELDRATESSTRIIEKARLYLRYWQSGNEQAQADVFPLVVWVVPDERRKDQLVDALGGLSPEHWQLFLVVTNGNAVARFLGLKESD